MAGFSIDIAANTRSVIAGAKDTANAFEDVADALDDLTRAADKSGDDIADSTKDAGRAAENLGRDYKTAAGRIEDGSDEGRRATDKLERSFKELADTAKRETRDAGDDLGRNVKRGTDKAESGFTDLKSEAAQSARETAASFREVGDAGDLVQEVLANALGGFGPIGLAAGIAGAAGFGILTEAINRGTEESKERVSAMYDDMTESGQKFVTDSYVSEAIKAIQTDAEGAVASYAQAQEIATMTGAELSTVLRGLAGDTAAQTEVESARTSALKEAQAEQAAYIAKNGEESASIEYNISTLETQAKAFDRTNSEKDTATEKARIYAQAMGDFAAANEGAASSVDVVKSKLAALPSSTTVRLSVDDSELERAITRQQGRTISVNLEGQVTRIGNQVW
jgi:hypothetical protein